MKRDSSIATRVLVWVAVAMVLGGATAGIAAASASAGSTLTGAALSTTDSVDDSIDEPTETVENTTDELENTTGTTTDELENTTETTIDELENTTETTIDELENTTGTTTDELENTTGTTVDRTEGAVDRTVNETPLDTGLEADAEVETDGRPSSPHDDGSSAGESTAENASADGSGDSDGSGTPGATETATDAVLVGLLGAITASGAAGGAGASGATGAAGSGTTATAGWLHTLRGTGPLRRAGDLWKMLPLFRYSQYDDSDPLEHDRRRAIYEAIRDDPGSYLSQLSDDTDIPLSTVRYHVRILEAEDLITAAKLNGKRRYFRDAADAELRAALAEPAKRDVLEALAGLGRAHNGRLADELERDPSTVSHHLAALEDDGLVVREKDGRSVVNELEPDAEAALCDDESVEGIEEVEDEQTESSAVASADD
ncbi:winged helix-turn-helix transcriptional regulator [Natrinema salaciae]|uniref:Helix-turn-helix domain-containing protein n=1 Tax=Natrinema salaciae TaxID=1186196 RepID=A0A1H9BBC7_9EURY|nr:helix-turn-helix domain-containing protein [Natrinema salaciae]SEP86296.1 Helix-turn-helix domain-containing protein [Natrinema salaciae]